MMVENGWYICPNCGQKMFKVSNDVVVRGIQQKCKKCRKIINIKIEPLSLSSK